MRTELKGKFVYLDTDEEINDVVYTLTCICGHALYSHACPYFYYERMFITSQCTKCQCEQFKLNEDLDG